MKNTLKLDAKSKKDLQTCADIIKNGGIVALPTETVYGLAANGLCETAVKKIYAAKNRPVVNPLILHCQNIDQAFSLFENDKDSFWYKRAMKLAKAFWPGPLTIVAPKANHIPSIVTAGLSTVAVRVPKEKVTREVIGLCGTALAMPSANISSRPSPTSWQHVLKTLNGKIDAVLMGNISDIGIESTIIDVTGDYATILRPGIISEDSLEEVLLEDVIFDENIDKERPKSPGQSFLHYRPNNKYIKLIEDGSLKQELLKEQIVIIREEDLILVIDHKATVIKMPNTVGSYAQKFYEALYKCEERPDIGVAIFFSKKNGKEWKPIMDKIERLCEKN